MLKDYRAITDVADLIVDAAELTVEAYRKGRITDEPNITDRFMNAIETKIQGLVTPLPPHERKRYRRLRGRRTDGNDPATARVGVVEQEMLAHTSSRQTQLRWEAATLRSSSGRAAEEKRYGADILGVLTIETAEFQTNKGFLAQAKRAEPGERFSSSEWQRLVGQCEKMLQCSRDAYVMVYSKKAGIRFFSGQAVSGFSGTDIFELYSLGVGDFFKRHLQSFIGDARLNQAHVSVLDAIHLSHASDHHVLHLSASDTS